MNFKNCSLVFLCATLFVTSCSKDGSNGVDGTDGKTALTRTTKEAAGANCKYGGSKFETGIDANNNGTLDDNEVTTTQTKYVCDGAGATYSSWIDVNLVDSTINDAGAGYFNSSQTISAVAITADIVNKGIVLMYYKSKNGTVFSVERDGYDGYNDLDSSGVNSFWFNTGFVFKEKNIYFLVKTWQREVMNANGSAIRYVLVPGMVQGRSMTDLKKMPYSEVAKLYNIKD